jgi:hypothetical protein
MNVTYDIQSHIMVGNFRVSCHFQPIAGGILLLAPEHASVGTRQKQPTTGSHYFRLCADGTWAEAASVAAPELTGPSNSGEDVPNITPDVAEICINYYY